MSKKNNTKCKQLNGTRRKDKEIAQQQQQQQQHSLLSQASWGRLKIKPKRDEK
jgi:hypothetical protein